MRLIVLYDAFINKWKWRIVQGDILLSALPHADSREEAFLHARTALEGIGNVVGYYAHNKYAVDQVLKKAEVVE